MDAFYAAVAQRDDPSLMGFAVGVGGSGPRGVLMTASYEARRFGVKSAMPTTQAKRLCPGLIVVRPNFEAYREASEIIRCIFDANASAVEPLALDEAFLDVTEQLDPNEQAITRANNIRKQIFAATALPASAGVSYNKFLAKTASNIAKPDGCTVIKPHRARDVLAALPIEAFFGVGPATARRMHDNGIHAGADLQRASESFLLSRFGRTGLVYRQLALGIDERPVSPSGNRKSLSVEETFTTDIHGRESIRQELELVIGTLHQRVETSGFRGQTVTLKIRTSDFRQMTRSITASAPIVNKQRMREHALVLLDRFEDLSEPTRLIGLGLSNQAQLQTAIQLELPLERQMLPRIV